jgi:hypothetical protein
MSTYNGWSSYETWAVKLWIDNEQGSYEEARDLAKQAKEMSPEPKAWLADHFKEEYEEARPEVEGVWADLLGAALGSVDWFEIAESLLSEIEEEVDA